MKWKGTAYQDACRSSEEPGLVRAGISRPRKLWKNAACVDACRSSQTPGAHQRRYQLPSDAGKDAQAQTPVDPDTGYEDVWMRTMLKTTWTTSVRTYGQIRCRITPG
ncbi:uncharacterized protein [Penaeus vannamei]|uniref:uncharacterized protein n=1 Tax=Penaeus vannamei TaxID=6689 RepID=UPI00387F6652